MGEAQYIDIDHLKVYVADDVALKDEILSIFEEQAERWAEHFDPTHTDEDWYDAAHALKGAARGVGAWALGDLCEDAEKLVGDLDDKENARRTLLTAVLDNLTATVDEARRLRG